MRNELSFLRHEFGRYRSEKKVKTKIELSDEENVTLNEIKRKGWAVVDSQFSSEFIHESISEIDRLMTDYKGKVQKDREGADSRLFGADRVSKPIHQFFTHQLAQNVLDGYCQMKSSYKTTMCGKISAVHNNLGSGGGWHRDSVTSRQVKSILYLSDVSLENGPFQYLDGSHKRQHVLTISQKLKRKWDSTRFTNDEIDILTEEFDFNISTITANAGQMILVDSSGIHRGMPLFNGVRYALTNYIWYNQKVPNKFHKLILQPA